VNPALVRTLGDASVEAVLARGLAEIFVDPGELAAGLARATEAGPRRARWRTASGQVLTVELHVHPCDEPDGPAALVGGGDASFDVSVVDVTALARADQELAHQRAALATAATMLDLVVNQMTAVYWIVDRDLRLVRTGGAMREVLGYAPGRFIGMTVEQTYQVEPGSVDPTVMHRRALAGETVRYATVYRKKHLLTTVCPDRRDGVIVGAIGTCIDVTSHHLLESRMVDAQRAESLGVLAGGLAHDLNNLLVAIQGNVELALREPPSDPRRGPLDNIRQASMRAGELIEQLLAYAGHGAAVTTRVSASRVIDELLRISAATMPANVTIDVDVARDLVLRGDPSQIRQVLLNLIANARDALGTRGGRIKVTGGHVRHDGASHGDDVVTAAAGSYVVLAVADDGPGIERQVRRRIFEPFFTTKPTGHGLGLAAVLAIMRSHGGGLRVTTAPGGGARFEARWPSVATPTRGQAATANPTVLIIDREEKIRDVAARMLEDLGYAAITASDGPSGLAIADSVPVDAVLVDLSAPRISGIDFVAALRARRPKLPIIVCSAEDRTATDPSADAYLGKPFQIDALDRTLARLLPG
jgi:two-component system, cell cycle sensor histidine kinase and response regulator CckA